MMIRAETFDIPAYGKDRQGSSGGYKKVVATGFEPVTFSV